MNISNRIFGIIILICCLLLILYFAFPHLLWIRTTFESWIYCFFFVVPIILLVVANRFKKNNDIPGRNLSYWAAFSFVGIILFPVFVFFVDFIFFGIDLPDFIIFIFPSISLVLSLIVVYKLFINNQVVTP